MKQRERIIFGSYLKEHIRTVILYGLSVLLLLGMAELYRYDGAVKNMSYAVFLLIFFGILYGIWDYIRYRRKCIMLYRAIDRSGERSACLPEGNSYIDELYRQMIEAVEAEECRFQTEYDEKKKDMTDYYTMWTHQIKTPIAAMRLLLQGEKQPLEELFKIEQYAEMALHYARLDSISSDLLFQTQDVYAVIKQAVTDEKWLSFVFEQILSNALKYTHEGGIRIYGLDENGEKTQAAASFVVFEDSGIGIREEDLPRIFERGFTGHNGRLDKKSTGIGLYLCRQILDRLSHTIRVESRIGEGTRVIVGLKV